MPTLKASVEIHKNVWISITSLHLNIIKTNPKYPRNYQYHSTNAIFPKNKPYSEIQIKPDPL